MADSKVKLHGTWESTFSRRVEVALKLKGVDFEYIEEDLDNKSPELLHHNPIHKKIPALVHGSKAILESQLILEYIDETWDSSTPLLPRDPYQRAVARFWAKFIDEKLIPSLAKGFLLGQDKAMEEAFEHMKVLEKELEGKRFFGGESIGFVDIVANTIAYWVGGFEEATDKVMLTDDVFPSVCRWRDEFLSCQVIRETLPAPKEKLVAFFRDRINTIKGQASQQ